MPHELRKISAAFLDSLPRDKTVFFFPVGPIEDHGPHLPMGLDLLEAEHLCLLEADRLEKEMPGWSGILMPTAPLGIDSDTTATALTVRAHVLRDWLVDAGVALAKKGFVHFVCFSGHSGPRQLTAIEEADKLIRMRSGRNWLGRILRRAPKAPALASASSALVSPRMQFRSPLWPTAEDHGGAEDTSIALRLAPDCVEPHFGALPPRLRLSGVARILARARGRAQGYWGRPSEGSPEKGDEILTAKAQELFPKLRAVWEGANPQNVFRSWYSIFPPNRSFFKAWILLFVAFVLLMGWVYLTASHLLT